MEEESQRQENDLESQQTLPSVASDTHGGLWDCLLTLIRMAQSLFVSKTCQSTNESTLRLPGDGDHSLSTLPAFTLDINSAGADGVDHNDEPDDFYSAREDSSTDHGEDGEDDVVDSFDIQLKSINTIINKRDNDLLIAFGGAPSIAYALGSDLEKGIASDDEHQCFRWPSTMPNLQAPPTPRDMFTCCLLIKSPKNYVIYLLLLAALLSIGFGITEEGLGTGWLQGFIMLDIVVILLVVPFLCKLWKDIVAESEGESSECKRELEVAVVRGGAHKKIFFAYVLVGDILCLQRGDVVPANGLLVSGDSLELDEADGCNAVVNIVKNPFLFCGAEVLNGDGRMLVTSVVENRELAEKMNMINSASSTAAATTTTNSETKVVRQPFETQLDKVNIWKQIVGAVVYIIIIVASFMRFELTREQVKPGFPDARGKPVPVENFKNFVLDRIYVLLIGRKNFTSLVTSLTLLLIGVVEGLPFCVAVAIMYWSRKGLSFVKKLSACVALGSVTAICTDIRGGLTLKPLEVGEFWIGDGKITGDYSIIAPKIREPLCEGIGISLSIPLAFCLETEEPILSWAVRKFHIELELPRPYVIKKLIRDDQELGGRGVLVKKNNGEIDIMCSHWRGVPTNILPKCSFYYSKEGVINAIDEQRKADFQQIVEQMQTASNQVVAFAYKDSTTDVPAVEETGLTLLGLVGLKASSREDIQQPIRTCESAGVRIILVSRDDVDTLIEIARRYGIYPTNANETNFITGEDFSRLTEAERMETVNRIVGMASSSPSDKLNLVRYLKMKGDSVAFIGIGTNDLPALREADVGLAMGIWSNITARASADIVMWGTNFSYTVTVLRYGRCICNNTRKYIQFELTMFVSWTLITFISIASTGNMPITTIELLWTNFIVLMLGGLALMIESPSEEVMKRPFGGNEAVVITKAMRINIISQGIYQVTSVVTLQLRGQEMLHITGKANKTIIFNSFVLCQIFNQFNAREMIRRNLFRDVYKNHWFLLAFGLTLLLQIAFVETAHVRFGNAKLNWVQWSYCLMIGAVSLAVDLVEKCILSFIRQMLSVDL
ncbi:hypothetical protein TIFTF001_006139 [Ficus carica]|uniref:Cation-transporting P-type ATPase C-terminal domain-containing protein n=1 Tax=Ficus carica TaxID=3494 RepID=A0AA87ZMB7_FICCA|nr:hypothetical protein TIFTF001_006139 [Ficus carica]